MLGHELAAVFANAAIPQKIVLALLLAAIPATLLATVLARRTMALGVASSASSAWPVPRSGCWSGR